MPWKLSSLLLLCQEFCSTSTTNWSCFLSSAPHPGRRSAATTTAQARSAGPLKPSNSPCGTSGSPSLPSTGAAAVLSAAAKVGHPRLLAAVASCSEADHSSSSSSSLSSTTLTPPSLLKRVPATAPRSAATPAATSIPSAGSAPEAAGAATEVFPLRAGETGWQKVPGDSVPPPRRTSSAARPTTAESGCQLTKGRRSAP
mmetsp:Transcript_118630/g.308213  ORF Transcript_118630/g.308213 Transcript_118630/m.308213 type:complete len:200 (-) Transcript_118630:181-780(-)